MRKLYRFLARRASYIAHIDPLVRAKIVHMGVIKLQVRKLCVLGSRWSNGACGAGCIRGGRSGWVVVLNDAQRGVIVMPPDSRRQRVPIVWWKYYARKTFANWFGNRKVWVGVCRCGCVWYYEWDIYIRLTLICVYNVLISLCDCFFFARFLLLFWYVFSLCPIHLGLCGDVVGVCDG